MAELLCRIYVKRPRAADAKLLSALFEGASVDLFRRHAESVNPRDGAGLASKFVQHERILDELRAEDNRRIGSFSMWQFVLGRDGPSIVEATLPFLSQLLSGSDAWAYVRGDDDPTESWYRMEEGRLVVEEVDATNESARQEAIDSVYSWWHAGLPKSICEGYWVETRDEVPKPRKPRQIVGKTKVATADDEIWESLFFGITNLEGQEPDWPDPAREHQVAIRLLKLMPVTRRLDQAEWQRCDGSYGYINYDFSARATVRLHHLNYAALCVATDSKIKQFVVNHPESQLLVRREGDSVRVEKRRGPDILETTFYDVDQILELIDQAVLAAIS